MTENWNNIFKVENYIKNFIPKGWKEPIGKVMFIPIILATEIEGILQGNYPTRFNKPPIKWALDSYRKKKEEE